MSKLALFGGDPEVKEPIAPADTSLHGLHIDITTPLSGYLGGVARGGRMVCQLEERWAERFNVKHAIACNSATSGLLAAAAAIDLGPGDMFLTTPYTMSATAAAPMFLGAVPYFCDIEDQTFCLAKAGPVGRSPRAIVVTNLFGHPARLARMRQMCDEMGWHMIEDNSHAPFAMEGDRYAGTIGHLGVFSLNVHKHIQCGEGGVVVTDDDALCARCRSFINHGEMSGGNIGLNLRMTEMSAAVALAQLDRADDIIAKRIDLAWALSEAVGDLSGINLPIEKPGYRHVFYVWAAKFEIVPGRDWFVKAMNAEGVPLRAGYVKPLYKLPAFSNYARPCPVTCRVERELMLFEVCAHDPTIEQVGQIGNAFAKVMEHVDALEE